MNNKLTTKSLLLSIFVSLPCILASCSSFKPKDNDLSLAHIPSDVSDKIGDYQIESLRDKDLAKLQSYPTLFEISLSEGKASFDRLIFFFQSYTSAYKPQNVHSEMQVLRIESSNANDPILYRVDRKLKGFNVEYAVSAADSKNPKNSKILAANLARFIREGELDMQFAHKRK